MVCLPVNREPINFSIMYLLCDITFSTGMLSLFFILKVGDVEEVVPEVVIELNMVGEAFSVIRLLVQSLPMKEK